MRWSDFKPLLADAIVAHLEPIQRRARAHTAHANPHQAT